MKPIINPWIVYLAEKCEVIQTLFLIIGVLSVVALAVWTMGYLGGDTEIKPFRWFIVLTIFCIVAGVLTPKKDTVLTMATLNYVTEDNVKALGNTAGDVIDYVIDKIEEITDKD